MQGNTQEAHHARQSTTWKQGFTETAAHSRQAHAIHDRGPLTLHIGTRIIPGGGSLGNAGVARPLSAASDDAVVDDPAACPSDSAGLPARVLLLEAGVLLPEELGSEAPPARIANK
jgi:hypothetical protein